MRPGLLPVWAGGIARWGCVDNAIDAGIHGILPSGLWLAATGCVSALPLLRSGRIRQDLYSPSMLTRYPSPVPRNG